MGALGIRVWGLWGLGFRVWVVGFGLKALVGLTRGHGLGRVLLRVSTEWASI